MQNRRHFMNSKERSQLKGLAMNIDTIINIGKSSLTPEVTEAVAEALEKRELVKIGVLKNCIDDPNEIARVLAERTKSEVVQVIGKKIVLYKKNTKKANNSKTNNKQR
jgi:RNA-binding protein